MTLRMRMVVDLWLAIYTDIFFVLSCSACIVCYTGESQNYLNKDLSGTSDDRFDVFWEISEPVNLQTKKRSPDRYVILSPMPRSCNDFVVLMSASRLLTYRKTLLRICKKRETGFVTQTHLLSISLAQNRTFFASLSAV
ncbi:hypothetical protein L596_029358 [Steinernema carpocapsae]|uniref:Uncharacterized protein n=1 Tax=Steinernema carpocapsae TaxID=34508 RepID=A0A4U5LUE5_STECR|nr:hypothetical protein L596_029358 [Steinernema carpocapsae]